MLCNYISVSGGQGHPVSPGKQHEWLAGEEWTDVEPRCGLKRSPHMGACWHAVRVAILPRVILETHSLNGSGNRICGWHPFSFHSGASN